MCHCCRVTMLIISRLLCNVCFHLVRFVGLSKHWNILQGTLVRHFTHCHCKGETFDRKVGNVRSSTPTQQCLTAVPTVPVPMQHYLLCHAALLSAICYAYRLLPQHYLLSTTTQCNCLPCMWSTRTTATPRSLRRSSSLLHTGNLTPLLPPGPACSFTPSDCVLPCPTAYPADWQLNTSIVS